mmetsp:Transcript_35611/g.83271  ORF Transcript_35611/g.83271 Transcript_35611/m.83271 type:complete len:371 (+) Transcript_35611:63-1175(+)
MGLTKKQKVERAQKLRQECAEQEREIMRADCVLAVNNHPEVIPKVWEVIKTFDISHESLAQEQPTGPKTAAGKKKAAKRMARAQELAAVADPKDFIDTQKVPDLGSFKMVEYRTDFLPLLDKSAFSKANLIAAESAMGKEGYLQVLEFSTGLPRDYPLADPMNSRKRVRDLLVEQQALRPGRTLGFSLPPTWGNECGIFKLLEGPDRLSVQLKHRWTGATFLVPSEELPQHECFEDLFLDRNYSEERVAIASKMSTGPNDRYLCSRVCKSHTLSASTLFMAESPESRKRRMALENGPAAKRRTRPALQDAPRMPALADRAHEDLGTAAAEAAEEGDGDSEPTPTEMPTPPAAVSALVQDESALEIPAEGS